MADIKLSVLDLVSVRQGATTRDAFAATRRLAEVADAAGCRRYWVAEHHNTASVASTNPPVIIAMLAAATERIRVGSGGVMLPNHAPLVVAEQFALLEAAYPGRIDLGIGRAPGTDPVTAWALRSAGSSDADPVSHFPEYVQQVQALMESDGVGVELGGKVYPMRATPAAASSPPLWLLGSSDYSATLAARLGLPYVFAHHFAGAGTAEALALYRSQYAGAGRPTTFLTANAVVADSQQEADRLALPFQHAMANLRTGRGGSFRIPTVETAEATTPPLPATAFDAIREPWLVGTPDDVAFGIKALAARFGVDEVMIQPIAGSYDADPLDRFPAREHTVQALARALA